MSNPHASAFIFLSNLYYDLANADASDRSPIGNFSNAVVLDFILQWQQEECPQDASDLEGGTILWGDGGGLQKRAEDCSGVSTGLSYV